MLDVRSLGGCRLFVNQFNFYLPSTFYYRFNGQWRNQRRETSLGVTARADVLNLVFQIQQTFGHQKARAVQNSYRQLETFKVLLSLQKSRNGSVAHAQRPLPSNFYLFFIFSSGHAPFLSNACAQLVHSACALHCKSTNFNP